MTVIGLTGNIACGKSTVARMLADLGADVIDADKLVHALQAPGTPIHRAISQRFGEAVILPDGSLDRARLGAIVFADATELVWLEGLIHPSVVAKTERLVESSGAAIVVIEAVKLVEAGMLRLCDQFWLVICRADVQLARLIARGTDESTARARIAAQPDPTPRVGLADVVIDNSGTVEGTRVQVLAAWTKLSAR